MKNFFARLLGRIVEIRPGEFSALWLAFLFNFVVLGGYYVIRPIRDEIGASSGIENLPWMFTAVLITMLLANALFAAIVARMSRRRFIPIAYRFFIANLVIFYLLMRIVPATQQQLLARFFFVWVSVFNLFATTVFWAFMTDLFTAEQGKRLFGFIAVGGSLGGILGPIITASLVHRVSTGVFLLICAAMLEIAAQCVRFFPSATHPADQDQRQTSEKPMGGNIWEGVVHICRSPYLLGLLLFILLYTSTSTWAYFQQADLTRFQIQDSATRTEFFAKLDLSVNTLTVLIQVFLTGRLLKWLGVGLTLVLMPALSLLGFMAIGFTPVLMALAIFQVLRRAATFALTRPAREVLFTVLRREDKYKAKSFIDTFAYRAGDQIGAWSYRALHDHGFNISATSFIAVPFVALWCGLSIWLGCKQTAMARERHLQSAQA
ncbi:MAG: MFS transporter [Chthoniobacterales bacterium]|nr:MAG: MFS transporter [Chthoniobacterales bacterium]